MAQLPKDVEERLARALGAFIRDIPTIELPRELKRWRSFRSQAIASHSGEIVTALDDSKIRDRVLKWVDDKPPLKASEARLLRIAAARDEGWEKELASASVARPKKTTGAARDKQLLERADRERKKALEAREELRKVRDEARRELLREKKSAADALKQVAALERKLESATASLERARSEVRKAAESGARERRRSKADTQRVREERDAARAQLRDVRRDNRQLQRKVRETESKLERAMSRNKPSKTPTSSRPRKRRALPAPAGLLADSPGALKRWLESGARLLVDGYNVTKAEGGFGDLSLADQRDRLVDELTRLALRHSGEITIVFDGAEVAAGTARRGRRRVKVQYSKPPESADDHLVALLTELPTDPVVVVTSDRELQERVAREGATVATSGQLLALLR
ncbi:MAG: NYN domain-containing protein [Actinomycetota bacterium]|nr:NYN domain-containing protein [Actinomycetota bacterium]